MMRAGLLLFATFNIVRCSGVGHVIQAVPHESAVGLAPSFSSVQPVIQRTPVIASEVPAPVVTAASSQYFERTFNRLVAVQPPLEPVVPVAPPPPVFVEPVTKTLPVAPLPVAPVEPNVAIAVATAHAAAPVATILLPPYPFGVPPSFGIAPSSPPIVVPDEPKNEPTTPKPTQIDTNINREPTTPQPSNIDNSFAQALPSNENVNFNQYAPQYPPLPPLQPKPSNTANNFAQGAPSNQNVKFKQYGPPLPKAKPQKLKTSVEVVPVPLAYIAPPPIRHAAIKTAHYHTYVPARTKIIIRPVLNVPLRIRTVKVPARLVVHTAPVAARKVAPRLTNAIRGPLNTRDVEPTTPRSFNRPSIKPPRL